MLLLRGERVRDSAMKDGASFLEFVDLVVNVTLAPSYIGNFRVGVEESLNSCLMRSVVVVFASRVVLS